MFDTANLDAWPLGTLCAFVTAFCIVSAYLAARALLREPKKLRKVKFGFAFCSFALMVPVFGFATWSVLVYAGTDNFYSGEPLASIIAACFFVGPVVQLTTIGLFGFESLARFGRRLRSKPSANQV